MEDESSPLKGIVLFTSQIGELPRTVHLYPPNIATNKHSRQNTKGAKVSQVNVIHMGGDVPDYVFNLPCTELLKLAMNSHSHHRCDIESKGCSISRSEFEMDYGDLNFHDYLLRVPREYTDISNDLKKVSFRWLVVNAQLRDNVIPVESQTKVVTKEDTTTRRVCIVLGMSPDFADTPKINKFYDKLAAFAEHLIGEKESLLVLSEKLESDGDDSGLITLLRSSFLELREMVTHDQTAHDLRNYNHTSKSTPLDTHRPDRSRSNKYDHVVHSLNPRQYFQKSSGDAIGYRGRWKGNSETYGSEHNSHSIFDKSSAANIIEAVDLNKTLAFVTSMGVIKGSEWITPLELAIIDSIRPTRPMIRLCDSSPKGNISLGALKRVVSGLLECSYAKQIPIIHHSTVFTTNIVKRVEEMSLSDEIDFTAQFGHHVFDNIYEILYHFSLELPISVVAAMNSPLIGNNTDVSIAWWLCGRSYIFQRTSRLLCIKPGICCHLQTSDVTTGIFPVRKELKPRITSTHPFKESQSIPGASYGSFEATASNQGGGFNTSNKIVEDLSLHWPDLQLEYLALIQKFVALAIQRRGLNRNKTRKLSTNRTSIKGNRHTYSVANRLVNNQTETHEEDTAKIEEIDFILRVISQFGFGGIADEMWQRIYSCGLYEVYTGGAWSMSVSPCVCSCLRSATDASSLLSSGSSMYRSTESWQKNNGCDKSDDSNLAEIVDQLNAYSVSSDGSMSHNSARHKIRGLFQHPWLQTSDLSDDALLSHRHAPLNSMKYRISKRMVIILKCLIETEFPVIGRLFQIFCT